MSENDNAVGTTEAQAVHIELTADIVSAFVSNNHIRPEELTALIGSVHAAIGSLGKAPEPEGPAVEKLTPAQIKKSITPDALISFLDGKAYKTLKRHLSKHGLDPASYRTRYGLPVDYPMVASSYSEARSAISRSTGLGRKKAVPARAEAAEIVSAPVEPASAPKPRGRRKKADAAE